MNKYIHVQRRLVFFPSLLTCPVCEEIEATVEIEVIAIRILRYYNSKSAKKRGNTINLIK